MRQACFTIFYSQSSIWKCEKYEKLLFLFLPGFKQNGKNEKIVFSQFLPLLKQIPFDIHSLRFVQTALIKTQFFWFSHTKTHFLPFFSQ